MSPRDIERLNSIMSAQGVHSTARKNVVLDIIVGDMADSLARALDSRVMRATELLSNIHSAPAIDVSIPALSRMVLKRFLATMPVSIDDLSKNVRANKFINGVAVADDEL